MASKAKTTKQPQTSAVVSAEDKQKAVQTAVNQIEKQFGKGAVMLLGKAETMNVEHISTGSLGLDMALGIGGVPRGRTV